MTDKVVTIVKAGDHVRITAGQWKGLRVKVLWFNSAGQPRCSWIDANGVEQEETFKRGQFEVCE